MAKEKVVVTGGAGFIGSHLVDRLISDGYHVAVCDNFDSYYEGKEDNVIHHKGDSNFELHRGDMLDYDFLRAVVRDADIIFHLAAQPGVRFSLENPVKTNLINTQGTLNVIRAAVEEKPRRLVLASSSSVYGTPIKTPVDESHPTRPLSVYGASKLAAEQYCSIYNRLRGVPTVSLRYHTVIGPRQRPDMAFYRWGKAILTGQSPIIYGDGSQMRDFTCVDDIVNGTILAGRSEDAVGEIFNLAAGRSVSVNRALDMLQRTLGRVAVAMKHEPSKPEDPAITHADISKAKRILGYSPRHTFEDTVQQFAKWMIGKSGQPSSV